METGVVKAIAELAQGAQKGRIELHSFGGMETPILINPTGEAQDLRKVIDAYRPFPEMIVGTAHMQTRESFIALVKRHMDKSTSAIFADTLSAGPAMCAVIDYHEEYEDKPRWLRHRINFRFPLSDEWNEWMGVKNKAMDQRTFAAFVQRRVMYLSAPEKIEVELADLLGVEAAMPAAMMTLSRGLRIHIASVAEEVIDPRTGEHSIQLTEKHNTAKGAKLVVPGMFVVRIPMFRGSPQHVRLPIHLSYRIDGTIEWRMEPHQPDVILRNAVLEAVEEVKKETGLPVFEGTPEA